MPLFCPEVLAEEEVRNLARRFARSVDPDLIVAIAEQESSFCPTATGLAGECGLMQILPSTAQWLTGVPYASCEGLLNPAQNVALGTRYLEYLYELFNGNIEKAISAYNAGPGTVKSRGIVNRGYVASVLRRYNDRKAKGSAQPYRFPSAQSFIEVIASPIKDNKGVGLILLLVLFIFLSLTVVLLRR